MSSTTEHPELAVAPVGPILRPVLSPRFALRLRHVVATGVFAALFLFLNAVPLRNTDLWGHIEYGSWILSHGALPTEDPWMPLAEGMPLVDSAWLAQVLLSVAETRLGAEGLSNLFAVVMGIAYLLLARVFYLQTGRISLTIVGTLAAVAVGWSRITTIRPEIFGVLGFNTLLWLMARRNACAGDATRSPGLALWIAGPTVCALWANLHGSFAVGVALLAGQAMGRAVDTFWRTRSVRTVLADRAVRSWIWLAEASFAATLLNPYGIDLWIETVRFVRNSNLLDITEWAPLVVLGVGGREFGLSVVALLFVWRHSRIRVPAADVILLAVFGLATVARVRMIGWYASVFVVALVPHLNDLLNRWWPAAGKSADVDDAATTDGGLPAGRSWRYSLACLAIVWTGFALSGMSRPLLGGESRTPESLYGESTPRGVTRYLREHPPRGQVYNPQWWGDWLVWDGPAGLQPFATTHVHLLPHTVWQDYRRISLAEAGWDTALDRYRITTLIVDRANQPALAALVTRQPTWRLLYEDEQALVMERPAKKLAQPSGH